MKQWSLTQYGDFWYYKKWGKLTANYMMLEEYSCVYLHTPFLSMKTLKEKGICIWQLVKIFHNFLTHKTPLNFSLLIHFMLALSGTVVPLREYFSWWMTSGLFKKAKSQLRGNGSWEMLWDQSTWEVLRILGISVYLK